ncbi:MAG TPA: hypothetical protein GXZ87_04135 [Bacteroidales bacterium]|nr:hypothetical protein [Bacteroidales bacterium]
MKTTLNYKVLIALVCLLLMTGCKYRHYSKQEYDLSTTAFSDTLKPKSTGSIIANRIIIIEGNLTGKAKLIIEKGTDKPITVELNGKVDTEIGNEWYTPNTIFWYEPDTTTNPKGKITIRYKV